MPPRSDLYILQMAQTGAIKVGRSGLPSSRLKAIQTGCAYECRLILVAPGEGGREKDIHHLLQRYRTGLFRGEWFAEPALGALPSDLYDRFDAKTLEMINSDWWRHVTVRHRFC